MLISHGSKIPSPLYFKNTTQFNPNHTLNDPQLHEDLKISHLQPCPPTLFYPRKNHTTHHSTPKSSRVSSPRSFVQVIWVCILCRKKQELLSKSGQWMMKSADSAMLRRMQEDMQGVLPPGVHTDLTQDKRPKLERAHSAAEKENLPLLQRSSSLLRRQYSHQDQVRYPSYTSYFSEMFALLVVK